MEREIRRLNHKLKKLEAEYALSRSAMRAERKALSIAREKLKDTETAREIAQNVAQTIQQKAHEEISEVVTKCLQSVFDDPYKFKIIFDRKRGKTEARLVFEKHGKEIDPMTASGGGVVDVAAFALRLSCLMLSRPTLRRVLILDEPFRFVSKEYREAVKNMMEILSEELGVQFIVVSHITEFLTGKIIKL